MPEKQLTLNDMLPFWWFVTWRTVCATILVNVLLGVLAMATGPIVQVALPFINFICLLVAQLYFMRMALNRTYKSVNMRISAQVDSQVQQIV